MFLFYLFFSYLNRRSKQATKMWILENQIQNWEKKKQKQKQNQHKENNCIYICWAPNYDDFFIIIII
jgi:hypothetical protein